MKLVSYIKEGHDQLALLVDGLLFDMESIHPDLPNNMSMFLNYWEDCISIVMGGEISIREGKISITKGKPFESVQLLSPIPFPTSCRDGYAFRQHVEAARRSRHAPMIPEFDQYPVFYFTNHHSIQGPGPIICMP
ncbi:MAG TPA: fumarylacetoacetate hydrolase family protein, partial [Puia sp.]|nr:fumarylacetoacetate hydrolase family protein [Puia sp.]